MVTAVGLVYKSTLFKWDQRLNQAGDLGFWNVCMWVYKTRKCFIEFSLKFVAGSVPHWTALCSGYYCGLAAGSGREVYYLLPSQLRQAWLLQDQAGEHEFQLRPSITNLKCLDPHWQSGFIQSNVVQVKYVILLHQTTLSVLQDQNREHHALNISFSLFFVSNTVRDVPRRPARTLLVRFRLERKENRRIQWCPRRCPLPPGDQSLNPSTTLSHTHTYTQAAFHKQSTFPNQDYLKSTYHLHIWFQHRAKDSMYIHYTFSYFSRDRLS